MCRDIIHLHIHIVHAKLRISLFKSLKPKINTIYIYRADKEMKWFLLSLIWVDQAVCHLLDIYLATLCFAQIEHSIIYTSRSYGKLLGYSRQWTHLSHNRPGIEECIAIHILHIKASHLNSIKHADSDMVNTYFGAQLLRRKVRCPVHGTVLHTRHREQQSTGNRQQYQQ